MKLHDRTFHMDFDPQEIQRLPWVEFVLDLFKEEGLLADPSELHELINKTLYTSQSPMHTLNNAKQFSVRKHILFAILSIRDYLILLHLLLQL